MKFKTTLLILFLILSYSGRSSTTEKVKDPLLFPQTFAKNAKMQQEATFLADTNCNQGDDDDGQNNGTNITSSHGFAAADDFFIAAGTSLHIAQIELPIQMLSGTEILNIKVNFYEDDNGVPGDLILAMENIEYSFVSQGVYSNFIEYVGFLDIDQTFVAENSDRHLWFEPIVEVDFFGGVFWGITTTGSLGNPYAYKGPWTDSWTPDESGLNTVFKLHCERATLPDEVCVINFAVVAPITRVSISNIDNASAPDDDLPLEDYTDIIGFLEPGESYSINLEGNTLGNEESFFTVFIDWNQDGFFEGEEEIYQIGSISNSNGTDGVQLTGIIAVPSDVDFGAIRMRVVKNHHEYPTEACHGYVSGQAEDYTLAIGELEDCTGVPEGGEIAINPTRGNPSSTYLVNSTGFSVNKQLLYQWQSNTENQGWVDEGAASDTYSLFRATAPEEIGTIVQWRLKVMCLTSNETGYSDIVEFKTELVYCIPPFQVGCDNGDYIDDFVLTGENNTGINDINTGCSPFGYSDRTGQEVSLFAGYDYIAEVSSGFFQNAVAVWIDFNNNGVFDDDELVGAVGGVNNELVDFQIKIPAGVAPGETRMRVMMQYVQFPSYIKPCDLFNDFGEAHDYTVNILETPICSGAPEAGETFTSIDRGLPDSSYIVSATGFSRNRNISFQWQSNTNGEGWINVGESSSFYQEIEAIAPSEYGSNVRWRLELKCNESGEVSTSEEALFSVIEEGDGCLWTINVYDDNFPGTDVYWELKNEDNEILLSVDGYEEFPYNDTKIIVANGPLTFHIASNGNFGSPIFTVSNGDEILVEGQLEGGGFERTYTDLNCKSLSISNIDQLGFSYYPNPVDKEIEIQSHSKIEKVTLFNLLGQNLLVVYPKNTSATINLGEFNSGIYLMKILIEDKTQTVRIIKN